jgi:phosphoglycolate phosphatase
MTYRMLVFDWDGTLYDSSAHIVESVQFAAKEVGLPQVESHRVKSMIGLSFDEAIKNVMPDISPVQMANFAKAFRDRIHDANLDQPKLFEGAKDILTDLKNEGYWLSIATGKGRQGLTKDLEILELTDYFMVTRTSDDARSKPHPQMLLDVLELAGVETHEALMIGDTEFDMQMAMNAKVDALAVTYGVHEKEQLLQNEIQGHLDDIRELPEWLKVKVRA